MSATISSPQNVFFQPINAFTQYLTTCSPSRVKKVALAILLSLATATVCAVTFSASSLLITGLVSLTLITAILIAAIAFKIFNQEAKQRNQIARDFHTNDPNSIVAHLKSFPDVTQLIDEANAVIQKFKLEPLKICMDEELPKSAVHNSTVTINPNWVRTQTIETIIRAVMFELINLTQHEAFNAVYENLKEYSTDEKFAKAVERVEFRTLIRCQQIATKINKQRYFKPLIGSKDEDICAESDFNLHYTQLLPDSHKENYRIHWRRRTARAGALVFRERLETLYNRLKLAQHPLKSTPYRLKRHY